MLEDTRSRLRAYMEEKGYSVASLEKAIGAGNGAIGLFLSGKNKGLGNNLEKILILFEHLNSRWLLTGEGESEIDYLGASNPDPGDGNELPSPKNEMHIKTPPKGVSYSTDKGGKVMGKVLGVLGNEKHIKPPTLSDGVRFMRTGYHDSVAEKAAEIFSDGEKPLYGDLRQHYELLMSGQNKLMRAILDRLEALERRTKDENQINRTEPSLHSDDEAHLPE